MAECEKVCRLSQLVGLPVYTLGDGRRLGNVKDVIFTPESGKLDAVTLEWPGFVRPLRRFLFLSDMKSLGKDAIMIQDASVLKDPQSARDEDRIVDAGSTLMGKHVFTDCGIDLGNIADVIINADTGLAEKYEVSGGTFSDVQSGRRVFPVPSALVVGSDAIVVPSSVESQMEAQEPGGLAGAYQQTQAGAGGLIGRMSDWWNRTRSGAAQAASEREADYVIGKKAGSAVTDDSGEVIVAEGDPINDDVVNRARTAGKLHQLALSAGYGATRSGYQTAMGRVTETGRRAASAAQERGVQYLLGKTAGRPVMDDSGNPIVDEGDVITQPVVDRAREAGKLQELTGSVAVAQASGLAQSTKDLVGQAGQKAGAAGESVSAQRLTAEQREMAKGKVSAVDIRDASGVIIVHEGEIFTPMMLSRLEGEGLLDQIHLKPIMGPERVSGEGGTPCIELIVRGEEVHHSGEPRHTTREAHE